MWPVNRSVEHDDFVIAVAFDGKMTKRNYNTVNTHTSNSFFIQAIHVYILLFKQHDRGNIENGCESFEQKLNERQYTPFFVCWLNISIEKKLSCIIELIKIAADGE